MKRKSDMARHQLPKNFPHDDSEFSYVKREMKRNYTTLKIPNQYYMTNEMPMFNFNEFMHSSTTVNSFLNDLIDNLQNDIQKIERKKLLKLTMNMTNMMDNELFNMQDPQKDLNDICLLSTQEPAKNSTDPISGFNKQHFIKKPKTNPTSNKDQTIISIKDSQISSIAGYSNLKKLPPLMKQLSQQKLQNLKFIPLQETSMRKKSTLDFEELIRQRLLKQIQNRKFKERIEAISSAKQNNQLTSSNGKKNSKSIFDAQRFNTTKQCFNFDYDGSKIPISTLSNVKSNMKILKALYKIPKQRPEQEKKFKLQKKFNERISYMPRCSRNYLQFNNKTIADFSQINYSAALKQKLEYELRKTDMKFNEKEYIQKEKQKKNSILV